MILKDSLCSATPPGEAKDGSRKLVPFNEQLNYARLLADAIRPYRVFSNLPRSVIICGTTATFGLTNR